VEAFFDDAGKFDIIHSTPQKKYTVGTVNVLDEEINISYKKE